MEGRAPSDAREIGAVGLHHGTHSLLPSRPLLKAMRPPSGDHEGDVSLDSSVRRVQVDVMRSRTTIPSSATASLAPSGPHHTSVGSARSHPGGTSPASGFARSATSRMLKDGDVSGSLSRMKASRRPSGERLTDTTPPKSQPRFNSASGEPSSGITRMRHCSWIEAIVSAEPSGDQAIVGLPDVPFSGNSSRTVPSASATVRTVVESFGYAL